MHKINLEEKAQALTGTIGYFTIQEETEKTFHYVNIPLFPFETGLLDDIYPVKTEIMIEWLDLGLSDPHSLNHIEVNSHTHPRAEASISIHQKNHFCRIGQLIFTQIEGNQFKVNGELWIDFEKHQLAQNESFAFEIEAALILAR